MRVKAKVLGVVTRPEGRDRISRPCRGRRSLGDRPAVRALELERPIRPACDLVALLVNCAMMPAAKQREIRERRGPALRPVMEMMPLGDANAAPGKAATAISML